MKRVQRGLGTFGMLVIVVLAVVAGYYAYKGVMAPDEPPSCKAALNQCIAKCRRTTSEAPAARACQESCERDFAACDSKR